MSAVHIAEARRADRVRVINRSIANLEKQITQGSFSEPGSYLRKHADWCREEIGNLQAEIERLGALDHDALIAEFAPEVARDKAIQEDLAKNGPVEFDPLGRGAMLPRQQVVRRTPPPVRREGGDPAPVAPGLVDVNGRSLPQGVVWTYDKSGNLVPAA
jgi:hypothetical protein